jgi:hypothetical protein
VSEDLKGLGPPQELSDSQGLHVRIGLRRAKLLDPGCSGPVARHMPHSPPLRDEVAHSGWVDALHREDGEVKDAAI